MIKNLTLSLFILSLLSACTSAPKRKTLSLGVWDQIRTEEARSPQGLQGSVYFRVVEKGKAGATVPGSLFVSSGGKFRLEAYDPFGAIRYLLVSDGKRVLFYDEPHQKLRLGKVGDAELTLRLRLPMPMGDLVPVLLGRAPHMEKKGWKMGGEKINGAPPWPCDGDARDNTAFERFDGKLRETTWVGPTKEGLQIRGIRLGAAVACFSRFKDHDGYPLADKVAIGRARPPKEGLILFWREMEINPKFNHELFKWKKVAAGFKLPVEAW